MPTGSVEPENMQAYLEFPKVFAVGGSWMTSPEFIREGRFDEVTRLARGAIESASKYRR